MLKKSIAVLLLVAILGGMLVACDEQAQGITSEKAVEIALADMGVSSDEVDSVHVHEGVYDKQVCYNVYITADGESLTYVVNKLNGDILNIQEGAAHSH